MCYTDAVVQDRQSGWPRVLIEVVHNSPKGPNGIVGLAVNADRVAAECGKLDLLFVVLARVSQFYCLDCMAAHDLRRLNHQDYGVSSQVT